MASVRRQKEAIRSALLSYVAGSHYLTEEVEKLRTDLDPASNTTKRQTFLDETYQMALGSKQMFDLFIDMLEEEEMYPFGVNWPREEMFELLSKLIAPEFSFGNDPEYYFRYKKGFKDLLLDVSHTAESHMKASHMLDHWLVSLINTSFYAGIALTAKMSEQPKLYYAGVEEIEMENEPWSKYPQIAHFLDKQLRRETKRKTGLVDMMDLDS